MQNKKIVFIIAAFVVLFGLIYFFVLDKKINQIKKGDTGVAKVGTKLDLPKSYCTFNSNQEAYNKAVADSAIDTCTCIDDEKLKETCINSTSDKINYDRALAYLDEDLCGAIVSEQGQDSCFAAVKNSVTQLREKDPQRLAEIYAMAHNENAISNYEKLIDNGSIDIKDYLALALAYAEKGLMEQEQGKSQDAYVNKAFDVLEKAKAIDSKNSEVYRVEGYINEIRPDLDRAMNNYNEAIKFDSKNILAYVGRGHLNRIKGTLESAVSDFNMAASLDENKENSSIYTNLCNLEFSRGNSDVAVKNCEIVVKDKKADPVFRSEAYQIMAVIFVQNKNVTQARTYLLNAKTLTPNDANLYVEFSKLNIFEKRYQDSEENARKAMELSPKKASAYLALSHALYMQGEFDESIDYAQQGITLVKSDVSLLVSVKPVMERDLNYSIANSYRQMGNSEKQSEYEKKAQESMNNK